MFTFILVICLLAVFGKLSVLALKGAWGLTKLVFTLIFLPVILIGMVLKGLIVIAVPVLLIFGAVALLTGDYA